MNILLTPTEILNIIANATYEELMSEGLMYDKMHKAQCLKLLEWLKKEHVIGRKDSTILELESKLKE